MWGAQEGATLPVPTRGVSLEDATSGVLGQLLIAELKSIPADVAASPATADAGSLGRSPSGTSVTRETPRRAPRDRRDLQLVPLADGLQQPCV